MDVVVLIERLSYGRFRYYGDDGGVFFEVDLALVHYYLLAAPECWNRYVVLWEGERSASG